MFLSYFTYWSVHFSIVGLPQHPIDGDYFVESFDLLILLRLFSSFLWFPLMAITLNDNNEFKKWLWTKEARCYGSVNVRVLLLFVSRCWHCRHNFQIKEIQIAFSPKMILESIYSLHLSNYTLPFSNLFSPAKFMKRKTYKKNVRHKKKTEISFIENK
jgi:hypothetical protein